VYAGIMTEYSKRTGLIIAARDCIRTLSCVQSRLTLIGNTDDLYGAICKYDDGSNSVVPVSPSPGSSAENPLYTSDVTPPAQEL
jgi:hypothetical protein